jgi:hypothetical protein
MVGFVLSALAIICSLPPSFYSFDHVVSPADLIGMFGWWMAASGVFAISGMVILANTENDE